MTVGLQVWHKTIGHNYYSRMEKVGKQKIPASLYLQGFTVGVLMGFALSVMGLSFDDFCRLQMREFTACCQSYNELRTAEMCGEWERMRMLATIVVQPHVRGKLTPQKLLPFEWEKAAKEASDREPVSKEESKARFEELVKGGGG